MKKEYIPELPDADPCSILGVSSDADDDGLRRAYLKKIREYPPDRDPEAFERIRDAYDILSNPLNRVRAQLFSVDPQQSLDTLLDDLESKIEFVGPGPWLAAMER